MFLGGAYLEVCSRRRAHLEASINEVVTLRLGADYFLNVWVKGKNIITIKAVSGIKGFKLWCTMLKEAEDSPETKKDSDQVQFYVPLFKKFDPYYTLIGKIDIE